MRPPSLLEVLRARGATIEDPSGDAEVRHYGDAAAEALQAAETGGLRDQSQHGRLRLSGGDRIPFLNGQCTADLLLVGAERAALAALTTVKGRVIDLARVFEEDDALGIMTSPGQADPVRETLSAKIVMEDCSLEDLGQERCSLLAFGPAAAAAVEKVFGAAPATVEDGFGALRLQWQGHTVHSLQTRAPGGGIELDLPTAAVAEAFSALADAGLHPVGEDAFEQLRIEAGIQALGREMGDHTNPLEAGLHFAVSFKKGCYVGQEVVARLHSRGKVKRQLVGLRFPLDADPTHLDEIFWDLLRVGNVSSAVRSPRLGATLALAMIKSDYAKPGTAVYSVKESEKIDGEVSELPFS